MAKKKEKEKKEIRKKYDYSDFIKTTMCDMILAKVPYIKEICEKYTTIEPMTPDEWKLFENLVVEISHAASAVGETNMNYRLEPVKRATYTLTNKVRERQSRSNILHFIKEITPDDRDYTIHCCRQIFTHMSIMCNENSRDFMKR
jgi:hypothetical protein